MAIPMSGGQAWPIVNAQLTPPTVRLTHVEVGGVTDAAEGEDPEILNLQTENTHTPQTHMYTYICYVMCFIYL